MKRPFLKTLSGKFVSRTVLLTLAIALVVSGLAIMSLRSLAGTANDSVANARANLPAEAVAPLEGLANDISSASSTLMLLLILITVAGAVAAGALALVSARQITAPLVNLRNAAVKSATILPEFVEASANGAEVLPELPALGLNSGDEVEDLASSFEQVQRTAAGLAIAQARMRQQNAERFVNLGRRSQNLLARQMTFIDAMEKDETIPANLQRLFQIDHLATRMRRNAESILVLADKSSPRRLRRPVSMHQVVQAASSEIEHFDRIAISDISGASVDGSVATDMAHLLAELLENATSFASPDAATSVTGRATEHGYLLEIMDRGIGMEAEAMAAANARFADHTGQLDEQHSSSYLGHDVVARLARRHGVAVELAPTEAGGVTARLHIPHSALASAEATAPAAQPTAAQPAAFAGHVEAPAEPEAPQEPVYTEVQEPVYTEVQAEPVYSEVAELTPTEEPVYTEVSAQEIPAFEEPAVIEPAFTEAAVSEPTVSEPALDSAAFNDAAFNDAAFSDPALMNDLGFGETSPLPDNLADMVPADASSLIDPIESVVTEAPVEPVAQPAAAEDDEWAERGLTADQRAAIEWAIEKGGSVSGAASPGDAAGLAAVGAADLRPGPIDAATLAELDTTPSGFQVRRRGEQGAMVFDAPTTAAASTPAPAAPRNPDQLMAFRQGVESGRTAAESAESPTYDNSAGDL